MVCRRGLAGTRRGYVTEALRAQDAYRPVPSHPEVAVGSPRVCAETGEAFAAVLRQMKLPGSVPHATPPTLDRSLYVRGVAARRPRAGE